MSNYCLLNAAHRDLFCSIYDQKNSKNLKKMRVNLCNKSNLIVLNLYTFEYFTKKFDLKSLWSKNKINIFLTAARNQLFGFKTFSLLVTVIENYLRPTFIYLRQNFAKYLCATNFLIIYLWRIVLIPTKVSRDIFCPFIELNAFVFGKKNYILKILCKKNDFLH